MRIMEQTFEITITSCEEGTWQGVLRTQEGDVPFRSEIELLLEISRRLEGGSVGRWKHCACKTEE